LYTNHIKMTIRFFLNEQKLLAAFLIALAVLGLNNQHIYAQANNHTNTIMLWGNTPPNGPGPGGAERVSDKGSYTNIAAPYLIVHKPLHANGTAILVISGGGYAHEELGNESTPAANWLQSEGVTAFELVYRLPAEGWASRDVPFQDGQRAVRLIRSMANKLGYDAEKIGVMGFSAGGHLAGILETEPDLRFYEPTDRVDRLPARVNFAALLYPVITMLPPYDHTHSEKEILGNHPQIDDQKAYSIQLLVNGQTPPTFLAQAIDDPISNIENTRLMESALRANNIPTERKTFPSGGHGWGMGKPGSPEEVWPSLFKKWAIRNGFWR